MHLRVRIQQAGNRYHILRIKQTHTDESSLLEYCSMLYANGILEGIPYLAFELYSMSLAGVLRK